MGARTSKCAMAPVHWTVRFIEVILETEKKTELEQVFGYCDQSRSVCIAPTPSGFAFLKFEDPLDAADAVRELHGGTLYDCWGPVELSNGENKSKSRRASLLTLEMISLCGSPLGTNLQGEASFETRTRQFLEIEVQGLCLVRDPDLDPSLALLAHLGHMKGSTRAVSLKKWRAGAASFDRSTCRKFKFCLKLRTRGALFKCFGCSHIFCLLEQLHI